MHLRHQSLIIIMMILPFICPVHPICPLCHVQPLMSLIWLAPHYSQSNAVHRPCPICEHIQVGCCTLSQPTRFLIHNNLNLHTSWFFPFLTIQQNLDCYLTSTICTNTSIVYSRLHFQTHKRKVVRPWFMGHNIWVSTAEAYPHRSTFMLRTI